MAEPMSRLDWLGLQWRIVLGVAAGALFGLIVGLVIGSYSACADSGCHFRVDLFEAVGTWVGGLGTIAAVLAAVVAFRGEESARRGQEHAELKALAKREAQDRAEAEQVSLFARATVIGLQDGAERVMAIEFGITNQANATPAYKVSWESNRFGFQRRTARLGPLEQKTTDVTLGGVDPNGPRPEPVVMLADDAAWQAVMLADVTVTFEMNQKRWQRRGIDPLELLGPAVS